MFVYFVYVQIVVLYKKGNNFLNFFFLINRKWGIWVGLGVIMLNVVDMVKYMNFYFSNMDKNGNEFMIIVNFNVLY